MVKFIKYGFPQWQSWSNTVSPNGEVLETSGENDKTVFPGQASSPVPMNEWTQVRDYFALLFSYIYTNE